MLCVTSSDVVIHSEPRYMGHQTISSILVDKPRSKGQVDH